LFGRELDRLESRYRAVRSALDTLAQDPGDAQANLTVGRWYCFLRGKWEKGLPYLARSNDSRVADLARRELEAPAVAQAQLELADAWWDLAGTLSDQEKTNVQAHAAHYYQQALTGLTGIDKLRVQQRLEEFSKSTEPAGAEPGGLIVPGNVALASNGTRVAGVEKNPLALIDGDSVRFDAQSLMGIAGSKCPCEWTITFDKVYRLREIRFRLFDAQQNRFFRYRVSVSADGVRYTPLVDRSQGEWRSWQTITFPPRPVKSIKLEGLYGSVYSWFLVIEFEAYCIPPQSP